MSTSEKLIYELCGDDVPCAVDFDKLYEEGYHQNNNSTTHIGGLSGTISDVGRDDVDTLYGAQFKTVRYRTPYYENMEVHTVNTPWLAEHQEHTFMNRIKELNEEPVQTYKDLELSPVPIERYEEYVPTIYRLEGFGEPMLGTNKMTTLVVILLILFIIYCVLSQA